MAKWFRVLDFIVGSRGFKGAKRHVNICLSGVALRGVWKFFKVIAREEHLARCVLGNKLK